MAVIKSFETKNVDSAVEIYIRYLTRYQGTFSPRLQMELTRGLIARNRLHLAAMGLEQWIKFNPNSGWRGNAARTLAAIYRRMGAYDLAEKTMKFAQRNPLKEKALSTSQAQPVGVAHPAKA